MGVVGYKSASHHNLTDMVVDASFIAKQNKRSEMSASQHNLTDRIVDASFIAKQNKRSVTSSLYIEIQHS